MRKHYEIKKKKEKTVQKGKRAKKLKWKAGGEKNGKDTKQSRTEENREEENPYFHTNNYYQCPYDGQMLLHVVLKVQNYVILFPRSFLHHPEIKETNTSLLIASQGSIYQYLSSYRDVLTLFFVAKTNLTTCKHK